MKTPTPEIRAELARHGVIELLELGDGKSLARLLPMSEERRDAIYHELSPGAREAWQDMAIDRERAVVILNELLAAGLVRKDGDGAFQLQILFPDDVQDRANRLTPDGTRMYCALLEAALATRERMQAERRHREN